MYGTLLKIHSILRWFVVLGAVLPLAGSYIALVRHRRWSAFDERIVSFGTGMSHLQLLIGLALYFSSPFVSLFWSDPSKGGENMQVFFFSLIHILGMMTSVVLITIGSSRSKRIVDDRGRFRSIALFWTIALVVILLLIPWPFSPLAQRPLWRPL